MMHLEILVFDLNVLVYRKIARQQNVALLLDILFQIKLEVLFIYFFKTEFLLVDLLIVELAL